MTLNDFKEELLDYCKKLKEDYKSPPTLCPDDTVIWENLGAREAIFYIENYIKNMHNVD